MLGFDLMGIQKKRQRRAVLRIQLGETIDSYVVGYAQEAHVSEETAEMEVKKALQDIISQM